MKKILLLFLMLISFIEFNAQEKKKESKKDTIKTEVVNIITSYNPKIADANKIKSIPKIKLLEKSKKKRLIYSISSVPVASTFIPKTGVVKGLDFGLKERIYENYIAAGIGNYTTPFLEASMHYATRFKNNMGLYTKYISSNDNVRNSVLNSKFSNFNTKVYFNQQKRYFDWTVTLNSSQSKYNWYGLSEYLKQSIIVDYIDSQQTFNYSQIVGDLEFKDSFLKKSSLSASYFSDEYNSSEVNIFLGTEFNFPLDFINNNLNDLSFDTNIEILNGNFKKDYNGNSEISYSIITAKIEPNYHFSFNDFLFRTGVKLFASFDRENNKNNILIYPEVKISKSIKNSITLYTGATGGLKTNTYKGFSDQNPYVSPTLFITQTSETVNAFIGTNGQFNKDMSFNIKASYKKEEDKPLFVRNNSKSDGTLILTNSTFLEGYEYGNSFGVIYSDVITSSLLGEFEHDITKNITTGITLKYDTYQVKNEYQAWNLPQLQATLSAGYKNDKWYATTNIFFVGDRKIVSDVIRTKFIRLNSFVDLNLNGGYHFNDKFSVFLKLNNVLNINYQIFANFDVQGFQALTGLTYKFDF